MTVICLLCFCPLPKRQRAKGLAVCARCDAKLCAELRPPMHEAMKLERQYLES